MEPGLDDAQAAPLLRLPFPLLVGIGRPELQLHVLELSRMGNQRRLQGAWVCPELFCIRPFVEEDGRKSRRIRLLDSGGLSRRVEQGGTDPGGQRIPWPRITPLLNRWHPRMQPPEARVVQGTGERGPENTQYGLPNAGIAGTASWPNCWDTSPTGRVISGRYGEPDSPHVNRFAGECAGGCRRGACTGRHLPQSARIPRRGK